MAPVSQLVYRPKLINIYLFFQHTRNLLDILMSELFIKAASFTKTPLTNYLDIVEATPWVKD